MVLGTGDLQRTSGRPHFRPHLHPEIRRRHATRRGHFPLENAPDLGAGEGPRQNRTLEVLGSIPSTSIESGPAAQAAGPDVFHATSTERAGLGSCARLSARGDLDLLEHRRWHRPLELPLDRHRPGAWCLT